MDDRKGKCLRKKFRYFFYKLNSTQLSDQLNFLLLKLLLNTRRSGLLPSEHSKDQAAVDLLKMPQPIHSLSKKINRWWDRKKSQNSESIFRFLFLSSLFFAKFLLFSVFHTVQWGWELGEKKVRTDNNNRK